MMYSSLLKMAWGLSNTPHGIFIYHRYFWCHGFCLITWLKQVLLELQLEAAAEPSTALGSTQN